MDLLTVRFTLTLAALVSLSPGLLAGGGSTATPPARVYAARGRLKRRRR